MLCLGLPFVSSGKLVVASFSLLLSCVAHDLFKSTALAFAGRKQSGDGQPPPTHTHICVFMLLEMRRKARKKQKGVSFPCLACRPPPRPAGTEVCGEMGGSGQARKASSNTTHAPRQPHPFWPRVARVGQNAFCLLHGSSDLTPTRTPSNHCSVSLLPSLPAQTSLFLVSIEDEPRSLRRGRGNCNSY